MNHVSEFLLIETVLWHQRNGYWLLEEHLARLSLSAEYFDFVYDREKVKQTLIRKAQENGDNQRIRLTLAKDGYIAISSVACEVPRHLQLPVVPKPAHKDLPCVAFSEVTIDSAEPWIMHKTTRREVYDVQFAKAKKNGLFDFLFQNERSEVTEGAITNLFIYSDGKYYTPPIECGLLAGTMRKHLLREWNGKIVEQPFTKEQVLDAEAVFVCNSVRGVVQVRVE